jgi:hypothetical protein
MFQKVLLCIPDVSSFFGTLRGTLIKTLMTLLCTFREANVATVTGDAFETQIVFVFLCTSEEILKEALKE